MTTDTVVKEVAVQAGGFVVGGVAKGAGMIHPDMATMLCFLATDAIADTGVLSRTLQAAVAKSFNMISVDGDTSTNDTVLLLANGASGQTVAGGSANAGFFQQAVETVCIYLAQAVARDGEGATKLIEVTVRGARTVPEARDAARTIVSSNLVKTAIHGGDPNWGRVIAAAGRSGAGLQENSLALSMAGVPVMRHGSPLQFDHAGLAALMKHEKVVIDLNLNLGQAEATAWGCDLSPEYVAINADYTT
jgi:glutamate N-acetyltransferase/amino-acid N-acetyltransferase